MVSSEPSFLFNVPVKQWLRILGALILLLQSFTLFVILDPYGHWGMFIYICIMFIALIMNFVLTIAVKRNQPSYLIAYMMYMTMGLVWLSGSMIGYIMAYSYYRSEPACGPEVPHDAKITTTPCYDPSIIPELTTELILTVIFCTISFSLDAVQLRLCFKFYKFLKKYNSARDFHVSYYANEVAPVPGAPPRYTPTAEQTAANSSDPGPLPPKPPMYETLDVVQLEENRQRASSQPPSYEEQDTPNPQLGNLLEL